MIGGNLPAFGGNVLTTTWTLPLILHHDLNVNRKVI